MEMVGTRKLETYEAIDMLSGLAQETRLRIFRELVKNHTPEENSGGLPAGMLADALDIPSPTLSFHLKEMSRAGLVYSRKNGRSVIYNANLAAMNSLVNHLLEDCCGGACELSLQNLRRNS